MLYKVFISMPGEKAAVNQETVLLGILIWAGGNKIPT